MGPPLVRYAQSCNGPEYHDPTGYRLKQGPRRPPCRTTLMVVPHCSNLQVSSVHAEVHVPVTSHGALTAYATGTLRFTAAYSPAAAAMADKRMPPRMSLSRRNIACRHREYRISKMVCALTENVTGIG